MSDSKRNPFVDLVKAAVGLSSGGNCSCGTATTDKPVEQRPVPEHPPQVEGCGCSGQAAPAPSPK